MVSKSTRVAVLEWPHNSTLNEYVENIIRVLSNIVTMECSSEIVHMRI